MLPPGPNGLLRRPFISIAGGTGIPNIGAKALRKKARFRLWRIGERCAQRMPV